MIQEDNRDGILVLTLDTGPGPQNTLSRAFNEAFLKRVKALRDDASVKGVVITSAKDGFAAGGDLDELAAVGSPDDVRAIVGPFMQALRELETMGKPVVAALNGTALGGGYELALGTHYRIAADRPDQQFGLPEAGLGLMPGGGGTQRLPRLIGLQKAGELILTGKTLPTAEALKAGLIDAVAPADELIERAIAWARAHPEAQQPWDVRGFHRDDADPNTKAGRAFMAGSWAMSRARAGLGDNAASAILMALHHGLERTFDAGLAIETREFAHLASSREARAKVRTLFYGPKAGKPVASGKARDRIQHLGVAGGGQMGIGIAFTAAKAGLQVTILDVSPEKAKEASQRIAAIGDKQVKRGRMTAEALAALTDRINATADVADLAAADFVIEAVFERLDVKHEVYRKLESVLRPEVTIASNTSSISIAALAAALKDPTRMVGMHFFAPVEVMKLLEIIRAPQTSDRALDEALAVAAKMRKTQITVTDTKGFYTSRLVSSLTVEALELLAEGVPPQVIDNVMTARGFAVGPATLVDLTKIPLLADIMASMAGEGAPIYMENTRAHEALAKLKEAGRSGRDTGAGIYDYTEDGPRPWPGLKDLFPATPDTPDAEEAARRLMNTQALEAVRTLDEGVIGSALSADIAAVMGWGFPAHLGGPAGYVDVLGAKELVAQSEALAARRGRRFTPPQSLRTLAESGKTLHDAFGGDAR